MTERYQGIGKARKIAIAAAIIGFPFLALFAAASLIDPSVG
ncbi:hypothetical protein [Erythrobacter sp. JK5]|nr:hypothetical protein [Erythrobacter sp. JK5]